jgi:hypothetical protein
VNAALSLLLPSFVPSQAHKDINPQTAAPFRSLSCHSSSILSPRASSLFFKKFVDNLSFV